MTTPATREEVVLRDMLLERVEADTNGGCWLWSGSLDAAGYGMLYTGGSRYPAHRLSYRLHKGDIGDGLFVCHRCDTPACCNPEHLFLGTCRDNVADCVAKGRNAKGDRHPKAQITSDDVRPICFAIMAGEPVSRVARRFGIASHSVRDILEGRSWREVERPEGFSWTPREHVKGWKRGGYNHRNERIRAAYRTGVKTDDIGELFGMTRQRVLQIVRAAK